MESKETILVQASIETLSSVVYQSQRTQHFVTSSALCTQLPTGDANILLLQVLRVTTGDANISLLQVLRVRAGDAPPQDELPVDLANGGYSLTRAPAENARRIARIGKYCVPHRKGSYSKISSKNPRNVSATEEMVSGNLCHPRKKPGHTQPNKADCPQKNSPNPYQLAQSNTYLFETAPRI